ncbi:MAG: hypothetical protein LCH32_05100 [Bacteroidetes bacterium]|nr:hypothetical protein [Bacteroidota bacterium]
MRLILLFLFTTSLYGQYFDTISIEKKITFVNYLKQNKQHEDALYILNHFNSREQIDSLILMEVKLLLELHREKLADSLLKSSLNLFSDSSKLNCSYTLLQNHVNILISKLDDLKKPNYTTNLIHYETWRIQQLATAILKNDFGGFEEIFNSGKCTNPNTSMIEFSLYVQKTEMFRRRKKSGFLAGLFSTIIPGSGKIYAGKPHEALTSFVPVVFNLAQAGEGYYYKKFESPHLYVFGSIGTVFYASNIYGSFKAAKRKNAEFNNKVKNNIEYEITKLISYY